MTDDPFRPRKQPKQARSRFLVDAIVAAAGRVLPRRGLDEFTIHQLADAAGVSVGSIYQYFPTKEAIVAALIERRAADDTSRVQQLLDEARERPVREVIPNLVREIVEMHRQGRALYRAMLPLVMRLRRHHYVRELVAALRDQIRAELEARRDEVRKENLDLAVFIAGHALESCIHAALQERPELLDDPAFASELADMATRYLTKDPP
jgi:AcrR family transcriptional regulator